MAIPSLCGSTPNPTAQYIMQASPKPRTPIQTSPKLEAEIRHNQRRIERLRQRNASLTQQLKEIAPQSDRYHRQAIASDAASTVTRTAKSRQIKPKRRQLSKQWLSIGIVLLCLIFCCGVIGFAVTRLIAVR
jgi:TolA-binding protein